MSASINPRRTTLKFADIAVPLSAARLALQILGEFNIFVPRKLIVAISTLAPATIRRHQRLG
jgi:hypothetical protein